MRAGPWRRPASTVPQPGDRRPRRLQRRGDRDLLARRQPRRPRTAPSGSSSIEDAGPDAPPDIYYLIFDRYGSGREPRRALRLRQLAVPRRAARARLLRRRGRARELHQDAAVAGQLTEHGLPRRRGAPGRGGIGQGRRRDPSPAAGTAAWCRASSRSSATGTSTSPTGGSRPPRTSTADVVLPLRGGLGVLVGPAAHVGAGRHRGRSRPRTPFDRAVLYEHTLYEFRVLEAARRRPGAEVRLRPLPRPPSAVRVRARWLLRPRRADRDRGRARRLPAPAGVHERAHPRPRRPAAGSRRPTSGRSSCSRPTRDRSRRATTPTSGASTGAHATTDELEEKFGILSAYHLPGVDPEAAGLYPSITPVNSFRVVFNTYFDAGLPLLPDEIYAHRSHAGTSTTSSR